MSGDTDSPDASRHEAHPAKVVMQLGGEAARWCAVPVVIHLGEQANANAFADGLRSFDIHQVGLDVGDFPFTQSSQFPISGN